MHDTSPTLETFYAGWEAYQRLLCDTLAPLSAEQLALTAAPHLRPAWVLAAHIISARVWWLHSVLKEESPELAPLITWDDDGQPARGAAELVDGLERSWALVRDALARWTPELLAQPYIWQRRGQERTITRQWVIWHLIEHDLHHGGQLYFTLGMHGLPTPNL